MDGKFCSYLVEVSVLNHGHGHAVATGAEVLGNELFLIIWNLKQMNQKVPTSKNKKPYIVTFFQKSTVLFYLQEQSADHFLGEIVQLLSCPFPLRSDNGIDPSLEQ